MLQSNNILSQEEKVEMLKDTRKWCKRMFPEEFSQPFNSFHDQIFEAIDAVGAGGIPIHQKIVIKAPRGIGKTSIIWDGYISKAICFRMTNFVLPIANVSDIAVRHGENLKRSLLANEMVRANFGSIKAQKYGEMAEAFGKECWIAGFEDGADGTMIFPRGAGQSVRGLKYGKYRPSFLLFDDIESAEDIGSEKYREDLKNWFFGTVMNCVDQMGSQTWRAVYIDTLKHPDSLLQTLCEDDTWYHLELPACTREYVTIDPGYITQKRLDDKIKEFRNNHNMDLFHMEFMGEAVAHEDASFVKEDFRYFTDSDIKKDTLETFVIVDPARSNNPKSAESGIIGAGIDFVNNKIYVLEDWTGYYHFDELYDKIFQLAIKIGAKSIFREVTGLGFHLTAPMDTRMDELGLRFEMVDLHATGGKGEYNRQGGGKCGRVASLCKFYRKHQVFHRQDGSCEQLEKQLLSFPTPKKWDRMDALGYIPFIIGKTGRVFSFDVDEDSDLRQEEEEFEPLEMLLI